MGRKRSTELVTQHALLAQDYHALCKAYAALEHPSLAARISSILGLPLEQAVKLLPRKWHARIRRAAEEAVRRASMAAFTTLDAQREIPAQNGLHKLMAAGSGAVGGFFGLPALAVELPVSTILMLRSIADIARGAGEDLSARETQLACMAVFAFGGTTHDDDYAEIGYYEVRSALALHFSSAIDNLMHHGGSAKALPATMELIRVIAHRFGVVVTDKAAAQMVPFIGAAAGAVINTIFMQHFQETAHGHFTVRRLERQYGPQCIEDAYRALSVREQSFEYAIKRNPSWV